MVQRHLFRVVIPRYPSVNIYTRVAHKTTALGPIMVATNVSRLPDWDVEVIDENNYRAPGPMDIDGLPDHAALQAIRPATVVGFYGGLTSTVPRLFAVAGYYQAQKVLTIGGGQHLDALPEEALASGLDVVVHGEGEITMTELLEAWAKGGPWRNIDGISTVQGGRTPDRPPHEDFTLLPQPDFGLLRYAHMVIYPVSRIRGCAMACEFCSVRGRPRCAPPELVMRQIIHLVENREARELFMVDDHFAQDRDQTLALCHCLVDYQRRTGIRLFITVQIRLDCGTDSELLQAMHAAGIRVVAIGIESPIDAELKAMNKHLNATRMIDLVRRFRAVGFMVHGMFIFAYPLRPGADFAMGWRERVAAFRRFIKQTRIDTIQILLPIPLPGTQFRQRMADSGRLVQGSAVDWEHYDGNFPLVVPDAPLTVGELHCGQFALMGSFYRFRSIFGVFFYTLGFPILMLPLTNLRARWRVWYRSWRNQVIAFAGSRLVARWREDFRRSDFSTIS